MFNLQIYFFENIFLCFFYQFRQNILRRVKRNVHKLRNAIFQFFDPLPRFYHKVLQMLTPLALRRAN